MRGRHIRGRWYTSRSRLTPANAGTTRYVAMAARRHGAHPRECGDDLTGGVAPPLTRGSPPRMRGRRGRRRERRAVRWLTPANAGTTAEYSAEGYFKEAHPRECGDDVGGMREIAKLHGSPPRMRGRHIFVLRRLEIIVAHPRECGDDSCGLRRLVEPELEFYHFLALRSRAALLHPARMVGRGGCSLGLRISVIPSKSTGFQSCLWTRKSRP